MFVVAVENRTAKISLQCIKDHILPGTTIFLDMRQAYNDIPALEGYMFELLTVYHSKDFVDPVTGAQTQHIERQWREVRSNIPRYRIRVKNIVSYLNEFLFKSGVPMLERVDQFL